MQSTILVQETTENGRESQSECAAACAAIANIEKKQEDFNATYENSVSDAEKVRVETMEYTESAENIGKYLTFWSLILLKNTRSFACQDFFVVLML